MCAAGAGELAAFESFDVFANGVEFADGCAAALQGLGACDEIGERDARDGEAEVGTRAA